MSIDRVDPLGGWFNLGDRPIDELPSLEASRVTQPRSSESQGMTQRVVQSVKQRFPAVAWEAGTAFTSYINVGQYLQDAGAAATAVFFAGVSLPIGSVINIIRWQANVTNTVGLSFSVGFQSVPDSAPGVPTGFSKASAKTGAWVINQIDLTTSGFDTYRKIVPDTTYNFTLTGVSPGAGSWKVAWVEIEYTLPG